MIFQIGSTKKNQWNQEYYRWWNPFGIFELWLILNVNCRLNIKVNIKYKIVRDIR